MCREEIVAALVRSPFHPFRIQMSDGSSYHVPRRESLLLTLNSVVIGIAGDRAMAEGDYPLMDHFVVVDLLHITRLEEGSMPSGNGQSPAT